MNMPKLPPEATAAIIGLVTHALKLDGRASSSVQSLAAGLGDMMEERDRSKLRSYLTAARTEVQAAHDDFRDAARGRPPRA